MNAFISYSHKNENYLERLHTHLANLKRDGLIHTWTDEAIMAGEKFEESISGSLKDSTIFIALLSPDYIGSKYCYEKEFELALKMQEEGKIIIIPIILEPCDWLSTPFNQFKALPKDGKPISDWSNINTAFLGVIQGIRHLLENQGSIEIQGNDKNVNLKAVRSYKVKKDFDSIEKLEFVEKAFIELKEHLKNNIKEVINLDNIKARVLISNDDSFECVIVNKNKIETEATLKISSSNGKDLSPIRNFGVTEYSIVWSIQGLDGSNSESSFNQEHDDYNMFWKKGGYSFQSDERKLSIQDMADIIWERWLNSIGIEF